MALEDKREDVLGKLSESFAKGDINEVEYERKVELATRASDESELSDIFGALFDQTIEGNQGQSPVPVSPDGQADFRPEQEQSYSGPREAEHNMVSIFSASDYKPSGAPARKINSFNVFGGGDIDLRNCPIPPEGLTISVVCVFGGLDIIVPPGVRVEKSTFSIFGAVENKAKDQDANGPLIRVEGVTIFGGVDIKTKLWK